VDATSSTGLELSYSLIDAPVGMRINEITGVVTWTPLTGQDSSGDVTITVTDEAGNSKSQVLNIAVADAAVSFKGFFVSTDGSDPTSNELNGIGEWNNTPGLLLDDSPRRDPEKPFETIKKACDLAKPGDNIYVRGGIYRNPGYGSGDLNNSSFSKIECNGEDGNPITIRPWGNEKVKVEFDSFQGLHVWGSYTILENFEVEGVNKKITIEEALADWWIGNNFYNGNGITVKGHHITIRENIVHHVPAAGIIAQTGSGHVTIENNIVYNSAWWTTKGTHGLSVQNTNSIDGSTEQNMKIVGNLVFGNESNIFSKVWSNEFSDLLIDEGAGLHVQIKNGNYEGGYLVENNFVLFNGKAMSINNTDDVDFLNNTLYLNGTTNASLFAGLRSNNSDNIEISRNAVVVPEGKMAYSITNGTETTDENYLVGADKPEDLPGGNFLVNKIFNDPENLNFSIVDTLPQNVGASTNTWIKLKAMADSYGIEIKPTGWIPDNEAMTEWIVKNPPSGATIHYDQDCDDNLDTEKVCIKNIPEGHVSGLTEFELRLKYEFER